MAGGLGLVAPRGFLTFAPLHTMGSNDPLMDVADSSQLMECFQEHGRWVGTRSVLHGAINGSNAVVPWPS
jgi:hypothetical protein